MWVSLAYIGLELEEMEAGLPPSGSLLVPHTHPQHLCRERERQEERETGRERDRKRDRQEERDRKRETDRKRDRKTQTGRDQKRERDREGVYV